jgi:hypothetical protein
MSEDKFIGVGGGPNPPAPHDWQKRFKDCESQLTDLRENLDRTGDNLHLALCEIDNLRACLRDERAAADITEQALREKLRVAEETIRQIRSENAVVYEAREFLITYGVNIAGLLKDKGFEGHAETMRNIINGLLKHSPASNPIAERAVEYLKENGETIYVVLFARVGEGDMTTELRAILSQLQEKPCEHKNCKAGNHPTEGHIVVCLDCGQEQ